MLGWRLVVSAILIPALIGIFWLDAHSGPGAPVLLVFCILLAIRASWELVDLLRARSFQPSFPLTALLSTLVVVAGWLPHLPPLVTPRGNGMSVHLPGNAWEGFAITFALAVLALFFAGCVRYREPGKSMETLGSELLTVSYVGLLLAVTSQLRFFAGGRGYLALGSLVVAAKCGDIGAYTLGRLFGKRKMVPLLSPGKTWMGAVGALAGAALGGWAWLTFAPPLFDPGWHAAAPAWSILFGAVIGAVGLLGDLAESLIKRDVGRKDSAALMPGFGGLLDLLDSVLYAGPVAYILWRVVPLAG